MIGSLAKYNIPYTDDEATDSLVRKLAQFYADRTLTKSPITPADQAEAYFLLISQRLSKTTGQVITVDGGLHKRFCAKSLPGAPFRAGSPDPARSGLAGVGLLERQGVVPTRVQGLRLVSPNHSIAAS